MRSTLRARARKRASVLLAALARDTPLRRFVLRYVDGVPARRRVDDFFSRALTPLGENPPVATLVAIARGEFAAGRLRATDWVFRRAAVRALRYVRARDALYSLRDLLGDGALAYDLCAAARKLKMRELVPDLLAVAARDGLGSQAMKTLAFWRAREAVPLLLPHIDRPDAVVILERIGVAGHEDALLDVLRSGDRRKLSAASGLLASTHSPRVRETLFAIARDERAPTVVREFALVGLMHDGAPGYLELALAWLERDGDGDGDDEALATRGHWVIHSWHAAPRAQRADFKALLAQRAAQASPSVRTQIEELLAVIARKEAGGL